MVLLALSYLLNVVDYLFTLQWVRLYGIEAEANPFGRWLLQNGLGGFVKFVVMAELFLILGVLIKQCPRAKYAVYIVFAGYLTVTLYHVSLAFSVL